MTLDAYCKRWRKVQRVPDTFTFANPDGFVSTQNRKVRRSYRGTVTGTKVGRRSVRVADLAELCTRQDLPAAVPLFLGVSFDEPAAAEPKREVLLDALRRAYPDVAARGVRAAQAPRPARWCPRACCSSCSASPGGPTSSPPPAMPPSTWAQM